MTRISEYEKMSREELIECADTLRQRLRLYIPQIPDTSELELYKKKEDILPVLIAIEGKMYENHNEDRNEIKAIFDEVTSGEVVKKPSSLIEV